MKKLFLLLAVLLSPSLGLAQGTTGGPTPGLALPDCNLPFSFTTAGSSANFDNRAIGCTAWDLMYYADGCSALSIQPQFAPDNNGVAGAMSIFPVTSVFGSIPLTATQQGQVTFAQFYPWVNVKLNTATGCTLVAGRMLGWKPQGSSEATAAANPSQGTAAEGTTAIGFPQQVGGKFETSPTVLSNGQQGVFQQDANQNLLVRVNASLPSGTSIVGKFGIDQSSPNVSNNVTVQQNVFGSTLNSSTAQLNSGATFTGSCESTLSANAIQVNVVSDQQITVEVDQSAVSNCSSIASAFTYVVPANNTASPFTNYTTQATNSFYRIKATNNGGSTTTTFRVDTAICPICSYGFASGGTFGIAAEASSAQGNPVQIGGRFETSPTALANGQQGVFQQDANQNLLTVINPTTLAADGITAIPSTATESSHVLKASAGNLYGACVTTGGTAGFLMVFNATTAPADGAVTPNEWIQIGANQTGCLSYGSGPPSVYSTGITVVFSSSGPFTKTASATAAFVGRVK